MYQKLQVLGRGGRWGAFFLLIPFGVMSANPSFRFSWLRPGTAWPCRMWWSGSNGATWLMSLGYAVASLWRMWRFYAGGPHNWMPRAICPWRPTLVAAICRTCLHKMCQERLKKQGVGGEGGQHGVEIAQKESGRRLDLRYLEVAWNWSCTIPFSVVARSKKESKSLWCGRNVWRFLAPLNGSDVGSQHPGALSLQLKHETDGMWMWVEMSSVKWGLALCTTVRNGLNEHNMIFQHWGATWPLNVLFDGRLTRVGAVRILYAMLGWAYHFATGFHGEWWNQPLYQS